MPSEVIFSCVEGSCSHSPSAVEGAGVGVRRSSLPGRWSWPFTPTLPQHSQTRGEGGLARSFGPSLWLQEGPFNCVKFSESCVFTKAYESPSLSTSSVRGTRSLS